MLSVSRSRVAQWQSLAAFAFLWVAAVLLTAMAVLSNSPVVIGVLVGAMVGVVLLLKPLWSIWTVVIGACVVSGLISLFAPQVTKATWLFSMIGFLLLFGSLGFAILRPASVSGIPAYVWLALAFMVHALVVSAINTTAVFEILAGFKRYFQLWGLMFCLAIMRIDERHVRQLIKLLLVIAFLQLPFAIGQLFVVAPLRVGLGGGVVPLDVVSGTFEATLEGGGSSSIMVMYLAVALAFFAAAWREGQLAAHRAFLAVILCLLPMFMGESKIAVVFLPIMLLIVFGRYIARNPVTSLFWIVVGVVVTGVLGWLYVSIFYGGPHLTIGQKIDHIIAYNFGNIGYYTPLGLNRTSVLRYWWEQHGLHNPVQFLFGHGLGSSYQSSSALVVGHAALRVPHLSIGLTGASMLLWDTGALGFVLFMLMLAQAGWTAHRAYAASTDPWLRTGLLAAQVAVALIAVMVFYSNSILASLSHEAIFMLVMGCIASASKQLRRLK